MNTQTEAERLADALNDHAKFPLITWTGKVEEATEAAAELRRLSAAKAELLGAVKGAYEYLWGADDDPIALQNKLKATIAKHSGEQP